MLFGEACRLSEDPAKEDSIFHYPEGLATAWDRSPLMLDKLKAQAQEACADFEMKQASALVASQCVWTISRKGDT